MTDMNEQEKEFELVLRAIREAFAEKIPFHRFLGIRFKDFGVDGVSIEIDSKEELIGNVIKGFLHGGVISALMDMAGGIAVTLSIADEMKGASLDEMVERIMKITTIDLRVDFLNPGRGNYFLAKGTVLRTGRSVAVSRMELFNDEKALIAVGTGSYRSG